MIVISGGQTGADRTALEIARSLGITTGGVAPANYRTENGPDPSLAAFGLSVSSSREYPPRTRQNVSMSDGTVWFGVTTSSGYYCTKKAIDHYHKPYVINPTTEELVAWLRKEKIWILNVAGNRYSTHPEIVEHVWNVLEPALIAVKQEAA